MAGRMKAQEHPSWPALNNALAVCAVTQAKLEEAASRLVAAGEDVLAQTVLRAAEAAADAGRLLCRQADVRGIREGDA